MAILRILEAVWVHLQPSAQELQLVAASAAVYLHCGLDTSIQVPLSACCHASTTLSFLCQNTSVELLSALARLDADVVWYELCKHAPPTPLFSNLDRLTAKHQFDYSSQLRGADTCYKAQASKLYDLIAELDQA